MACNSAFAVQIAWTAASRADCEFSGEMSFGACRESRSFLMSHVNPVDGTKAAERITETVERVAYDAINALDAGFSQRTCHEVCRCAHFGSFQRFALLFGDGVVLSCR
jgi:hypothetical protein